MSSILKLKLNREKKPYDKENLKRAYQATLSGMSVYRASRVYKVPESTLRDRTRQNVILDCKPGPTRLFSIEEEKQLADHIVYMANIGYGYTISEIQYMAADYARSIGKTVKAKEGLSQGWFYSFLNRWEQLKVASPQKLGMARAKCASKETIEKYFVELGTLLQDNDLLSAPERIYNVDESGFSTEHTPPKIVCAKDTCAQSVTSSRTKNVTVVGGANAVGNHVPPFYIFPGKRWSDSLLDGAAGSMSESGWINRGLFEKYLTSHFAKYVGLNRDTQTPKTLILYDGHKSHISLTLTNWANEHNVILFVLPPHSSHLTQPLDIGVFGPMKKYYYFECKAYMHSNPGVSITKYEIAKLTSRPYARAFSPENVISAFKKSGIYPFNSEMITSAHTAPATIYPSQCESDSVPNLQIAQVTDTSCTCNDPTTNQTEKVKDNAVALSFLDKRKITTVVQRPKKKFVPPLKVSGNLMSEKNLDTLKTMTENKLVSTARHSVPKKSSIEHKSPKPSTSGLVKNKGGPIHLDSSSSDESENEELCCVCMKSFPPQLRSCTSLVIVKWGQCDICGHWVHLTYCTEVRVLRRGSKFNCVHCPEE